ncbi:hypothetical protein DFO58_2775 [Arthrobacter sp. AG1021]|nr:hypothetical protein DFO58_2775 [Arthrobacter sp. AG1021]
MTEMLMVHLNGVHVANLLPDEMGGAALQYL